MQAQFSQIAFQGQLTNGNQFVNINSNKKVDNLISINDDGPIDAPSFLDRILLPFRVLALGKYPFEQLNLQVVLFE